MNNFNKIDDGLNILSLIYGLQNIQEILGIILLVLSIVSIIFKCGYKIYQHIKNKEYNKIPNVIDETIKEIKERENNGNK